MRFYSIIHLFPTAHSLPQSTSLWNSLRQAFAGNNQGNTQSKRIVMGSFALLDGFEGAFRRRGITNAVLLSIDQTTLFEDRKGQRDDLDFMVTAVSSDMSIFDQQFKRMDLVMEHDEGGMHFLIDTRINREIRGKETPVEVHITGQIQALRPKEGEEMDEFRERISTLVSSPSAMKPYQFLFHNFIDDLAKNLHSQLRVERISIEDPQLRVSKPSAAQLKQLQGKPLPVSPPRLRRNNERGQSRDPYERYYDDPASNILDAMLIGMAVNSMVSAVIPMVVVNDMGSVLGSTSDMGSFMQSFGGFDDLVSHDFTDPSAILSDIPESLPSLDGVTEGLELPDVSESSSFFDDFFGGDGLGGLFE